MKATRYLLLACLLLLPPAGCRAKQDLGSRLTGTWTIDQQGGDEAGELVLQNDRHFTARGLPSDLLDDSDQDGGKAITGSGTWTLRNQGDADRVALKFEQMEHVNPSELPQEAELSVEGGHELVMFYDPGDPDEDERVTFRKQSFFGRH